MYYSNFIYTNSLLLSSLLLHPPLIISLITRYSTRGKGGGKIKINQFLTLIPGLTQFMGHYKLFKSFSNPTQKAPFNVLHYIFQNFNTTLYFLQRYQV